MSKMSKNVYETSIPGQFTETKQFTAEQNKEGKNII